MVHIISRLVWIVASFFFLLAFCGIPESAQETGDIPSWFLWGALFVIAITSYMNEGSPDVDEDDPEYLKFRIGMI